MHTKLLIDSIMRQTTVLIAQLSSAAGIRAPLAHLADEVFLSLSRELESQGVPRKVVADMFGLALRSYQRRVQRLQGSVTDSETTLWQAVLAHLESHQQLSRADLFQRFRHDDPEALGAVLHDLVQSGLVSRTGASHVALYAVTPPEARRMLAREERVTTATTMIWLDICRHPGTLKAEVAARVGLEESVVSEALTSLEREGQLTSPMDGPLTAESMVIPVGAEEGWESAVFDHFQAVSAAITSKLRFGRARSHAADTTGGTTLCFEIHRGHPLEAEVLGLLSRMRELTDELWARVAEDNKNNPILEDQVRRVMFYFGQFEKDAEEDG